MKTMKAVRIHTFGSSETLVYEESPRPEPEAGQVLVRVHAVGVNPLDWKIREGWLQNFRHDSLPLILGGDISGIVEAVGYGVTSLQPGQEVYGVSNTMIGGYAEYGIAQADEIAPKPQSLDHVQSASVPIVAMTAWQALFEVGGMQAGEFVLVHGAAGGVGSFAVQFSKLQGLHVIGTASTRDLEYVRTLGADGVIDYQSTPFEQAISKVGMVLDTIGGETQTRSWQVLKSGGMLVSTAAPISEGIAAQYSVRGAMMSVQPRASLLTTIADLIDQGQVKINISRVFPLVEARQAQDLSQQGHAHGRIVLQAIAG
jgi:NADPH:quinone reductase-like Zn-dependent oxidoreductase